MCRKRSERELVLLMPAPEREEEKAGPSWEISGSDDDVRFTVTVVGNDDGGKDGRSGVL